MSRLFLGYPGLLKMKYSCRGKLRVTALIQLCLLLEYHYTITDRDTKGRYYLQRAWI